MIKIKVRLSDTGCPKISVRRERTGAGPLTIPSVPRKENREIQITLKSKTGWKEDCDHCEHLEGIIGISKCNKIANLRRNYNIQVELGWSKNIPLLGVLHRALAHGCFGASEPWQMNVKEIGFIFKDPSPLLEGHFPQFVGANVRSWKVCGRVWWVFSGGKTQLNPYSLLVVIKNSSGIYKLRLLLAWRHIHKIWIEMIICIISLFPLNIGKDRLLEINQRHYALHYNIFSSILSWAFI